MILGGRDHAGQGPDNGGGGRGNGGGKAPDQGQLARHDAPESGHGRLHRGQRTGAHPHDHVDATVSGGQRAGGSERTGQGDGGQCQGHRRGGSDGRAAGGAHGDSFGSGRHLVGGRNTQWRVRHAE